MPPITRIGVLTGGGDAPGLNAVIRAVVKSAYNSGIECIGLEDSFDGLLEPGRSRLLTPRDVTRHPAARRHDSRHRQPRQPVRRPDRDLRRPARATPIACVEMFHKMGLDALVVIGGDGTLAIAHQFCEPRHPDRRRAQDHR